MAHVLIADGNRDIREAMRWALEDAGHEVAEAPTGETALALLWASPRPVVAVLDMVMAGGGGLALLTAVRDDPQLAGRHGYLVATASSPSHLHLPDDLACLLALPVIQKPFDLDDFLAVVAQAAERLPAL